MFLSFSFIFQQLKSQISQIDQHGYDPFCDETLPIYVYRMIEGLTLKLFDSRIPHSVSTVEFYVTLKEWHKTE